MSVTFQDIVDDLQRVLTGIPDRPTLKLTTFDELKGRLTKKGREPRRRQKTLRALRDNLDTVRETLKRATFSGVLQAESPESFQKTITDQLQQLEDAIGIYQDHHKGRKANVVAPLLQEVKTLRNEVPKVVQSVQVFDESEASIFEAAQLLSNFNTKAFAGLTVSHLGKKGSIQTILSDEIKRLKTVIPPPAKGKEDLGQKLIDKLDLIEKSLLERIDALAKGTKAFPTNTPLSVVATIKPEQMKGISLAHTDFEKYNTQKEVPPPKKILGKGAANEVILINYADGAHVFKEEKSSDESKIWAVDYLGIDRKNPRYGNRNVASGMIAEKLGSVVLDPCTFAVNGDKVGLLMKKADGVTPKAIKNDETGSLNPFKGGLSKKALASLQKQMMNLEICDLITGQVDRHSENYLIDVSGDEVTIRGIDNDFAFGNKQPGGKIPNWAYGLHTLGSMPKLIDHEVATNILKLVFDRDIASELHSLLNLDEIQAAKERFLALQDHVRHLGKTGCIVKDWMTWRGPKRETVREFLNLPGEKGSGSYFSRDLDKLIPKM